ncbi:hypothetical protein Btru_048290 [Bulinus truncatus]|nr:hypothetical protein Btru_048290 [Bulinus truncatus]
MQSLALNPRMFKQIRRFIKPPLLRRQAVKATGTLTAAGGPVMKVLACLLVAVLIDVIYYYLTLEATGYVLDAKNISADLSHGQIPWCSGFSLARRLLKDCDINVMVRSSNFGLKLSNHESEENRSDWMPELYSGSAVQPIGFIKISVAAVLLGEFPSGLLIIYVHQLFV